MTPHFILPKSEGLGSELYWVGGLLIAERRLMSKSPRLPFVQKAHRGRRVTKASTK